MMAGLLIPESMIIATALRKDRQKKTPQIDRSHRCRICNNEEASVSIFKNEWKRNIAKEIESFSGVIITNNDIHPKFICQLCLHLLKSCILFRKTCQRTQKLLNEQPKPDIKIDTQNDDLILYIDNSGCDYDPNNDDGESTSNDIGETFQAQLDVQGTVQEKHICAECCQEYADKELYNFHLPFCETRKKENNKLIKKETDDKSLNADKSTVKIKPIFICDTCGKVFFDKQVLVQHMATHMNAFPYECEACPYRGRSADLLRAHECPEAAAAAARSDHELLRNRAPGTHDKESYNWPLSSCEDKGEAKNKSIKKEFGEKRRKAGYSKKKKKHLCQTCGKILSSKFVLGQHMRMHTNEFPYPCPLCPYRGRTAGLLRSHKRSHLADKPYKCALCPQAASNCSNLRRHVLAHHRAPGFDVKCTHCNKSFTNEWGLKKHVEDVHLRQGEHECDICNRNYTTREILRSHKRKVHKVQPAGKGRKPAYLQHLMKEKQESKRTELEGNIGEE